MYIHKYCTYFYTYIAILLVFIDVNKKLRGVGLTCLPNHVIIILAHSTSHSRTVVRDQIHTVAHQNVKYSPVKFFPLINVYKLQSRCCRQF